MSADLVTADDWFAGGTRRGYDPTTATITDSGAAGPAGDGRGLRVFERVRCGDATAPAARWTTFLPGFPDGSYGYARVDALLGDAVSPRLFLDYVGQGDSDKPRRYPYGTRERADLVEAQWRRHGISRTFVVSFDYSSLVVLELLARQHDRHTAGTRGVVIEAVLIVNGGLFADAHSHPWQSTPMLKTVAGRVGMWATQRSPRLFAQVMRAANLFSPEYQVTAAELRENHRAITRHDGAAFLHNAARFVDEHQVNAQRWDLGRLHTLLHDRVAFHIAGSVGDPYEHRQIETARARIGTRDLDIRMFPGGHMTTSEHPDLLAAVVSEIADATPVRGLVPLPTPATSTAPTAKAH